jgi:H(+)-translocating pyrophosphatase
MALLVLQLLVIVYTKFLMFDEFKSKAEAQKRAQEMFEMIAGYGLGGSTVALFGRVGGGIYTKAADVGADLAGKVVQGLPEDDERNPGTIADNVGDNVGDIAGMGSDLFGSLAESTCAALVVGATSNELLSTPNAMMFPLLVTAGGILASVLTTILAMFGEVTEKTVERKIKYQLVFSTVFMTAIVYPTATTFLPATFSIGAIVCTPMKAFACVASGLWSGLIIGFITEYYTSASYGPVQELAEACRLGAATNVILGLALGYVSCVIPIFCLAITIFISFQFAGMYGVALAALGMLGCLPIALSVDGYGPIADNAGGIAEMSGLHKQVRERTDLLDAAGNTTAAIGKGFAIGSACLVGLALFGAFVTRTKMGTVDILQPVQFSGLLLGAMLPYWFSAMTMKAVGEAAGAMIEEIERQFAGDNGHKIMTREKTPDYTACI